MFSPSSDSGGWEGDVPARKDSQVTSTAGTLPERKRSDRRAHARSRATRTTAVCPRTRDGTRSEAMVKITELQNFGGVLRTEVAGSRETFKITMEIEH